MKYTYDETQHTYNIQYTFTCETTFEEVMKIQWTRVFQCTNFLLKLLQFKKKKKKIKLFHLTLYLYY